MCVQLLNRHLTCPNVFRSIVPKDLRWGIFVVQDNTAQIQTILLISLVACIVVFLRKKKHRRDPWFTLRPVSRRFSRNPKNKGR